MDRELFLTWHTYGTWLPGSQQRFVGDTRDAGRNKVIQNEPGTPYAADLPGLHTYLQRNMKGAPIRLTREQAESFCPTSRNSSHSQLDAAWNEYLTHACPLAGWRFRRF